MKNKSKKVIGGVAGAAAAATAVGIAAARRKGKTSVFHVRQDDEGWFVSADGDSRASSRHDTKREAVAAGRDLAGTRAPSRLVIHRRDDSVQKEHSYEPEG